MNVSEIPGYQSALESEIAAREDAFVGTYYFLCGVKVRAMTLRDLIARLRANCPFFCGGGIRPGHIGAFIWQIRVWEPRWKTSLLRIFGLSEMKRFARKLACSVRYVDALIEIDEYVETIFQDQPSFRSGKRPVPKTSFAASLVHVLALHYHWSESEILDLPLPRLYQYLREIQLFKNPGATLFNRRSDKARGDYLRSIYKPNDSNQNGHFESAH